MLSFFTYICKQEVKLLWTTQYMIYYITKNTTTYENF